MRGVRRGFLGASPLARRLRVHRQRGHDLRGVVNAAAAAADDHVNRIVHRGNGAGKVGEVEHRRLVHHVHAHDVHVARRRLPDDLVGPRGVPARQEEAPGAQRARLYHGHFERVRSHDDLGTALKVDRTEVADAQAQRARVCLRGCDGRGAIEGVATLREQAQRPFPGAAAQRPDQRIGAQDEQQPEAAAQTTPSHWWKRAASCRRRRRRGRTGRTGRTGRIGGRRGGGGGGARGQPGGRSTFTYVNYCI